MSYVIEVQNPHDYAVDATYLHAAAAAALAAEGADEDASLTIRLDTDAAVAALNESYRGIAAPTDVLSFPADMPLMPGEAPYLGDLIIAHDYAAAQAARENHPLRESLALLVVHGTLHLLGYDHATPAERAAMWSVQAAILEKLNIPLGIVPALEYYDEKDDTDH